MRIFALLIFFLAIMPFVQSQEETAPAPATKPPAQKQFTQAQLEQMVAPIALYPDRLLAQVLAASTYPADVVAAERWVKKNPNLSQDEIKTELQGKKWDPSVQGLVFFPQLLSKMSGNLDWTKDLGDAFLEQQKDVMNTVQVMRAKAKEAGNLKSDTNQQVDATQEGQIQIQSANPDTEFVNNYVPSESYGSWNNGGSWDYPQVAVAPAYPWGCYGAGWALGYRCAWNHGYISHYNNNYFANANRYYPKDIANREWTHGQVAMRNLASSNTQDRDRQYGNDEYDAHNRNAYNENRNDYDRNRNAYNENRNDNDRNRNDYDKNRSYEGHQTRDNAFRSARSGEDERSYSDRGYSSRYKSSSDRNRPSHSYSHSGGYHSGGYHSGGGGGSHGGGGRR